MTAPGQTPNASSGEATPDGPSNPQPTRDIIPVWLIVAIFLVVMAVTGWLLGPNWFTDMARYRSIKAQQDRNYPEAIEQLKYLIEQGEKEKNPVISKSPTYFSEIAYSYSQMKDYENALKYYQLAQENRANMGADDQGAPRPPADFQNKLGYVQLQLGNVDAATTALQAALAHDKLDPLANFTLGQIAMQKGNYIAAADYFKVVANNPTYEAKVKKYYSEIEKKMFAGI